MSTATGNHSIQYIIREFVNPTQTDNFDKYNEYFCPKNMGNKI